MLELVTDTNVDLARSGARHGMGAFETIRAEGARALLLRRHLARLARATKFLGLPPPPPPEDVQAFVAKRKLLPGSGLSQLRLVAVDERLIVSTTPWGGAPPDPARLVISPSITRFAGNPLARHKTLAYAENILLAREAASHGCFDAVACNERGNLTDGGRCNVFAVIAGRVVTPPVADGCLPGIIRELLIEARLAVEQSLTQSELAAADACFLTSSLVEVLPMASIVGQPPRWRLDHPAITLALETVRAAAAREL
jgi:branched-chain amino acid aminotransferase